MTTFPLVSQAVEDILSHSFSSELQFGKHQYPNGTSEVAYSDHAHVSLDMACTASREKTLTNTDLLLCQTYAVAAQEEPPRLRTALVALGALVVDWLAQLDATEVCK